jgi:RNA polymerase sigma factor (sigma-70 family)
LEGRLFDVTGQTFDDLFPPELRNSKDFLKCPKLAEITREVPLRRLADIKADRLAIEDAGLADLENDDMGDAIGRALRILPLREREIIKLRYGLGDGYSHTLEEVGHIFNLTRTRIQSLEMRALRRLNEKGGLNQVAQAIGVVPYKDIVNSDEIPNTQT